ncbi:hypothetical protein [Aetokthonos hydrillicola]|nr:hypothetical protein [Aetokthonos hydrillicola]MBW4586077.1 hypothetical protein [Aetokthonos hydrillicola CCALA 1050]
MSLDSDFRCALCRQKLSENHKENCKGYQPDKCPNCGKAFPKDFDRLRFNGYLSPRNVRSIVQSQAQASSLCAVSQIGRLVYKNMVSLVWTINQEFGNKLKYLLHKLSRKAEGRRQLC